MRFQNYIFYFITKYFQQKVQMLANDSCIRMLESFAFDPLSKPNFFCDHTPRMVYIAFYKLLSMYVSILLHRLYACPNTRKRAIDFFWWPLQREREKKQIKMRNKSHLYAYKATTYHTDKAGMSSIKLKVDFVTDRFVSVASWFSYILVNITK